MSHRHPAPLRPVLMMMLVLAVSGLSACGGGSGGSSDAGDGSAADAVGDAVTDAAGPAGDSVIGGGGDATTGAPDGGHPGPDADASAGTDGASPVDVLGDAAHPDALGDVGAPDSGSPPGDAAGDTGVGPGDASDPDSSDPDSSNPDSSNPDSSEPDAGADLDAPCAPECAGKVCGGDGCGGLCGTCADTQACDLTGQCHPAGSGDTCADPLVITGPGWSGSADTTGALNGFAYEAGACEGVAAGFGAASSDHVYAFVPPITGVYTVQLDASFDSTLYVAELCADVDASCLGADDAFGPGVESVTFSAGEGLVYYVFVDGWDNSVNEAGAYTLSMSEPCVPQCDGKSCGADGCGGACGTCPVGLVCDDETYACVQNPACGAATPIPSAPFSVAGDTSASTNDFSYGDLSCAGVPTGYGAGSNDDVYVFTAEAGGVYTFTVTAEFDSVTYVAGDCYDVDGSCAGAADAVGAGVEELQLLLSQGQTVFVFVDGWQNGDNVAGPYTLEVSAPCLPECADNDCGSNGCGGVCGQCGAGQVCDPTGHCLDGSQLPGNTCANPLDIPEAPWSGTGSTVDATNDLSVPPDVCPGDVSALGLGSASSDNVWRFVAPLDATYRVWLQPDAFDSALYVTTDCAEPGDACLGADDAGFAQLEEVYIAASAGQTYWIIVDGWSNSDNVAGPYTLGVDAPCLPACQGKQCGADGCGASCGTCLAGEGCDASQQCVPVSALPGDTCVDAVPLGAAPLTYQGETLNASPTFGFADGACPGDYYGGGAGSSDRVHRFTAGVAGLYTFVLDADFDSLLVVASLCEDVGGSCLGAEDTLDVETVSVALDADQEVYVVVDGWSDFDNLAGAYTLTVLEPCVPSCEGKVCGDDGCGGSCGGCADGEYCGELGQCVDSSTIPGNFCGAPFVVGAVPFSGGGDTHAATNDFHVGDGVCQVGPAGAKGAASDDHVWLFAPQMAGTYTITLTPAEPGFDTALYVLADCAQPQQSCLAVDDVVGAPEVVKVHVGAGEAVYIVVDGWSNTDNLEGAYTLTVSEPCAPACEGKQCGADGCGSFCGFCAPGDLCDPAGVCLPATSLPGNTCDNPFIIDTVPFTADGDTTVASNLMGVSGGACPGASTAKGGGSNDQIYLFTAPESGTYTVEIDALFDAVLYVLGDCQDASGSCLGASDVAFSTGVEAVPFSAVAGTTYTVVVDGWSPNDNVAGPYTLTLGPPCVPQCEGKQCGADGCGGSCGSCSGSDLCGPAGTCTSCQPACEGKQCGDDGCGGSCGTCGGGTGCVTNPGVADFGTCQAGALCAGDAQCTFDGAAPCQCDASCFSEAYLDCCDDICQACPASGGGAGACVWPPAP